jgi:hypothetical protein
MGLERDMMIHDWNADACSSANSIRRDMPASERGAFHTGVPGVCLAYGADDYAHDHRARLEVTLLRQRLYDAGLAELGFGTSYDGRVWVLMVQTNDADSLTNALLDAWRVAFDLKA